MSIFLFYYNINIIVLRQSNVLGEQLVPSVDIQLTQSK